MTDQTSTDCSSDGRTRAPAPRSAPIPVLWFDRKGCGPDEMALELRDFPPDNGGAIPAHIGIQIRSGGTVILGGPLVDGGFYLGRDQAEALRDQLGAWLEANP